MSSRKLHELDGLKRKDRYYLEENDRCLYFMEKLSEGYTASYENQLIFNFKKPIDKKGKPEWFYKEKAIERFAYDLCSLDGLELYTIIPAPTSKPRRYPEWDDRIDQVVDKLAQCKQGITIEKAIDTHSAHTPTHYGERKSIDEIYNNTVWNGFYNEPTEIVILIDDVLTSGAHFKAWKRFILNNDFRIKDVIGIFWAIQIWDYPDINIEELQF